MLVLNKIVLWGELPSCNVPLKKISDKLSWSAKSKTTLIEYRHLMGLCWFCEAVITRGLFLTDKFDRPLLILSDVCVLVPVAKIYGSNSVKTK